MTIEISGRVEPRDHVVLFYENDDELATAVVRYSHDGLAADETVVVVATPAHLEAFEAALSDAGIDVAAARANGTWVTLDAADAMARFLVGGWPDPEVFEMAIGDFVLQQIAAGRRVRIYGEMVALLWDAGQVAAAIELESLWNQLGERLSFSLLCSYPVDAVAKHDHGDSFHRLCRSHSSVVGDSPVWPADGGPVGIGRAEATRSFVCDATELSSARQFVVGILRAWKLQHFAEDAAIVVSELATNAILHARSDFIVTVSLRGSTVRLSVRDASLALPTVRNPSPTMVSGRGLILVGRIARAWGTERVADGKVVWVELQA